MTATYQQAGVTYNSLFHTYNGFTVADKPVFRVELDRGGYLYEDDYDYEFDASYGSESAVLDPIPAWEDITETVANIRIRRGTDNFLIRQPEAGSMTVVFEDPDSRFLPTNTSSPYFGRIEPSVGIRVVAEWSDAETIMFRGVTQRWAQNFRPAQENTEVVLTCVDFTQLLYEFKIDLTSIGSSGDATGTRVNEILSDTGPNALRTPWPAALRNVSAGTATIEQDAAQTVRVIDALKIVADSEWGFGFMAKNGVYTFLDRQEANPGVGGLANPDYFFAEADSVTVGADTHPAGRFDQIETQADDDTLANVVEVVDAFGNVGGWKYPDGIGESEERTFRVETLLQTPGGFGGAQTLALFILQSQYQPLIRIRRLGFYNSSSIAATRAGVLSELAEEVYVKLTAPGAVNVQFNGTIAAIEHDISRDFWYTTYTFSPGEFDPFASTVGEAL